MIYLIFSKAIEKQRTILNYLKAKYIAGTNIKITDAFLWPLEYRGVEFKGYYERVIEKGQDSVVEVMLEIPDVLIGFESGKIKQLSFKPMCRLLYESSKIGFAFYEEGKTQLTIKE